MPDDRCPGRRQELSVSPGRTGCEASPRRACDRPERDSPPQHDRLRRRSGPVLAFTLTLLRITGCPSWAWGPRGGRLLLDHPNRWFTATQLLTRAWWDPALSPEEVATTSADFALSLRSSRFHASLS